MEDANKQLSLARSRSHYRDVRVCTIKVLRVAWGCQSVSSAMCAHQFVVRSVRVHHWGFASGEVQGLGCMSCSCILGSVLPQLLCC